MCYVYDGTGWQAKVLRLVDVFIDGLRRQPDKRHDRISPRTISPVKQPGPH
jgi:hypothetical protein